MCQRDGVHVDVHGQEENVHAQNVLLLWYLRDPYHHSLALRASRSGCSLVGCSFASLCIWRSFVKQSHVETFSNKQI